MSYNPFDNPRLLLTLAILLEVGVLVFWAVRRIRLRWFLLGPVLAGLALLADGLVETPREQMDRVTREIVHAAEAEDAPAVLDRLSDDFAHMQIIGKVAVSVMVRQYLNQPVIDKNQITRLDVQDVQENSGQVELVVLSFMDRRGPYASYASVIKTVWRFDFGRDPDGRFRVRDMELLRINDQRGFDVFSGKGIPRDLFGE